jgi:hypothetical protein
VGVEGITGVSIDTSGTPHISLRTVSQTGGAQGFGFQTTNTGVNDLKSLINGKILEKDGKQGARVLPLEINWKPNEGRKRLMRKK